MKNLIFLFFSLSVLAQPAIVLHTENEPPFSMRKNEKNTGRPDDPLKGISVEILDTLFGRLKIPKVMRIDLWEIGYKKVLSSPNQGIFGTTRTSERERLFKWVGPLVANDWYLIGREDFEGDFRDIRDPRFKALRIGSLKGGAISSFLKSNGISPIEIDSNFNSVLALKEKKIDLWAIGAQPGFYYAKLSGAENLKRVFLLKRHQFLYLALNIKTPDSLVNTLNKELGIMRRDGTITRIFRKYNRL